MLRCLSLFCALFLAFAPGPAAAECVGRNLISEMPPDEADALFSAANAVPFPAGNFWRATRGDEVITLAGTYHLDDPRHAATLTGLMPHITAAATVLVEAGPEEQRKLLDLIAREPARMLITEGPTLIDRLPPDTWTALSAALAERGIPGFMAAKVQPWYAAALLAIPPCAMAGMAEPRGLDGLVIDAASAAGLPVLGLEPYDTIFTIFDQIPEAEMVAMLDATLAMEPAAEDYSVTLADSYFAGQNRLIWEFTRQATLALPGQDPDVVNASFARMEEVLMNARNRAWIPVLLDAAADGPVFAAFGALHLPGEEGVLNLLQAQGFTIEELVL